MQIEKGRDDVVNLRKTTKTDFILTNKEHETKEITIENFTNDDEISGYDSDETIYYDNEVIADWEEFILAFDKDADPDNVLDELRDMIEK